MKPASGTPKRAIKVKNSSSLSSLEGYHSHAASQRNGSHAEYLNALIKANGLMRLLPRSPRYPTHLAVPFDVERVFLYLSSPESGLLALVQSLLATRCLRQIVEVDELEVQTQACQGTRWR